MEVIAGSFGKRAPDNLAQRLREIADAVDRGEITELVAAFVQDDHFTFEWSASLTMSLQLSTLLQHESVAKFKS